MDIPYVPNVNPSRAKCLPFGWIEFGIVGRSKYCVYGYFQKIFQLCHTIPTNLPFHPSNPGESVAKILQKTFPYTPWDCHICRPIDPRGTTTPTAPSCVFSDRQGELGHRNALELSASWTPERRGRITGGTPAAFGGVSMGHCRKRLFQGQVIHRVLKDPVVPSEVRWDWGEWRVSYRT